MKLKLNWQKHFLRIKALCHEHRSGIWIGVGVSAMLLLLVGRPDAQEKRVIFQRQPGLDFKDAEILGNPRQSILQGQEALFLKTRRSALDSEAELKTELATLKAEVEKLKVQPNPMPSPGVLSLGAASAYGPQPLQSSVASPSAINIPSLGPPAPGVTAYDVHSGTKDVIRQQQAAPERGSFGWISGASGGRSKKPGANMVSFPVKSTGKVFLRKPGIILPSGSYVKATLLTGVEAPEGKSYPVLLQLDYAYIIPNDKRLDLAGCFMIAKAQGDLSTERVQMQTTKLSCVSQRGGMFEREVNGFVADDEDNSFAVMGRVNSKQERVAATSFLASVVSGIGKAIQQAQTTSQVTPLGGSQSVLTGDQTKFIGAGGASEAATMVTQWYLKQAQNLLPTINVGSGQNVWVIMQDQVDLPKEYFNSKGAPNESIYSYFTRVVD